jgi:hypothetical protein
MAMVRHFQSDDNAAVTVATAVIAETEALGVEVDAVATVVTEVTEVVDHEDLVTIAADDENVETSTLTTTVVMMTHHDATEGRAELLADMMEAVDDQVRLADDRSEVLSINR